jgi:hypothetical protein
MSLSYYYLLIENKNRKIDEFNNSENTSHQLIDNFNYLILQ